MDMKGSQSVRIVLHNLELLEGILQYLSGCKKTLISASLTAKAFSEPAFNVLWYEMPSIWPLFLILPTFEKGTNGKYAFTGPIRNEHLQRLFYYAKRIRHLHYRDDSTYSDVPPDLMISTFMRMDKLGAFVPLRRINFHSPLFNAMPLPLTSPNLDAIEIRTTATQSEIAEIGIASSLLSVAHSPLLRSLVIDGSFRDITFRVLPDFVNLHHLMISLKRSHIPAHFLKRFASSMPSLRRLQIYINYCLPALPNDGSQRLGQPPSIFRLSFPSLQTLDVACDSTYLGNLLGSLDAPLLKSFTLDVSQSRNTSLHQFIESNRQVLKDKVHRLFVKTTEPFLLDLAKSFENLRVLSLSSLNRIIPMCDIMATFTYEGLWSRSLVHLQLIQTWTVLINLFPSFVCLGMSIRALLVIADACPNLESLQISICHPMTPGKQADNQRKPHKLKELLFLNLPCGWDETMPLAVDLASYLDLLFPTMNVPQYVGAGTDKPGAMAKREEWWKGVQDLWGTFQTIKDRQRIKQPPSA